MVEFKNVSKTFKKKKTKVQALKNLTFKIEQGEIVTILGRNGAGKTTLIKCLCNIFIPDEGEIYINDLNTCKNNTNKEIASVFEGARNIYWTLTPSENLEFFYRMKKGKKNPDLIDKYIKIFELEEKKNSIVSSLSRGMQQKTAIACAFIQDCPILVLDEPTLGLDIEFAAKMNKLIIDTAKETGKTIIITTHDMNLVNSSSDRIMILNDGEIIEFDYIDRLANLIETNYLKIKISSENSLNLERIINTSGLQFSIVNYNTYDEFQIEIKDISQMVEVSTLIFSEKIYPNSISVNNTDIENLYIALLNKKI